MKKSHLMLLVVLMMVDKVVQATEIYGQLWSKATTSHLSVDRAVLGVKTSLGGKYTADLGVNAATASSLQTAKVSVADLLTPGDALSLGLQATSFEGYLDGKLGQQPWRCHGCTNQKSLTYGLTLGTTGIALQAREGKEFSLLASHAVPFFGDAAVAAEYNETTKKWTGKGALVKSIGAVQAALVLNIADEVDYSISATYQYNKLVGAYGEAARGNKFAIGPVLHPADHLDVAALWKRDGEKDRVDVHVAAAF